MRAEIERDLMEQNSVDELVQKIIDLKVLAEDEDNDDACEAMDDALDETIVFALENMDRYNLLELLKNSLGVHTLEKLANNFKEICIKHGVDENEEED